MTINTTHDGYNKQVREQFLLSRMTSCESIWAKRGVQQNVFDSFSFFVSDIQLEKRGVYHVFDNMAITAYLMLTLLGGEAGRGDRGAQQQSEAHHWRRRQGLKLVHFSS